MSLTDPTFPLEPGCQLIDEAKHLCRPVDTGAAETDADQSPVDGPKFVTDHICYKTKCPKLPDSDFQVADRFGARIMSVIRARELCVPAGGEPTGFTCLKVDDPLEVIGTVVTHDVELHVSPPCKIDGSAIRLCISQTGPGETPATAGNEPEPPGARVCYRIDCPDEVPTADVIIHDALGKRELTDLEPSVLCVPATLLPPAGTGSESGPQADVAGGRDDTDVPRVFGPAQGCGDANADGAITASDALSALLTAVGTGSGCGTCACDVNDSGSVTASDALAILLFAVGTETELTCPDGPFDVAWDGGGDGTSWHDPVNWNGDALPRFCDRVTIDVSEDPTVTFSRTSLSIFSLTATDDLSVSGGAMTLRQDSSLDATLSLLAGTITANAALDVGELVRSNGALSGTGTITATDTLTLAGPQYVLSGIDLINEGAATWSTGTMFQDGDAVFRNAQGATFEITGDTTLRTNGGANNLFDNQGTFTRSAGAGDARFSVRFQNSGDARIQTGDVNCTGGYTQTAAGSLTTDVSGTTPADIGRLTGNAMTLDGEMVVNVTGGYAPQLGDVFTVLSYTTRVGAFATLTGTDVGGGLSLQETYGANGLSFEVAGP